MSPHVHVIVHGHNIHTRACKVADRHNKIMPHVVGDVPPVCVQLIGLSLLDLMRVVRYLWMAPDRHKASYFNPRTGRHNLHQSEAPNRYIRYLRQFQIHSLLHLSELCFTHGALKRTRANIVRATFAWLEQRVPVARRRDELERMAEFWAEFMPRLGHSRFSMPIIHR